uniref:GTP cyclohydrolase I FolE n=1 Tax=Agathobacter sp. TaxID=2021311 RepID=UPI0040560711
MVDKKKIEEGVRLILEGIGEDINREGLKDTPDRIARMYEEIFAGMGQDAKEPLSKTFRADNEEMVIEKDIVFYSTCEHHFMPFYGKAHVAYIPNGKVVGLSKLARTVEVFAKRPQIQEQLTTQIADALMEYLNPKGVMVMMEAEHMCMTMRGIKKPGSKTVTFAMRGAFEEDETLVNRFMMLCK